MISKKNQFFFLFLFISYAGLSILPGCSCIIVLPPGDVEKLPDAGKERHPLKLCKLKIEPNEVDFGVLPLGEKEERTVEITNEGENDCTLSTLELIGKKPLGTQVFSWGEYPSFPHLLEPDKSLVVSLVFEPNIRGTLFNGELKIHLLVKREEESAIVELIGRSGEPCLEVTKLANFGLAQAQCTNQTRDVKIRHKGYKHCPESIDIKDISLSDGISKEFRIKQQPKTSFKLHAGQSALVTILYVPIDRGTDKGELIFTTNAPGQEKLKSELLGKATLLRAQRDLFQQAAESLVDILFIVDNSLSMRQEQNSLAVNFKSFIKWASRLNTNYHIGVVTTDVRHRRHLPPPGCLVGTPRIITPKTLNLSATFSRNIRVGINGSSREQGLESAFLALRAPVANDPNCNKGFLRSGAIFSMVFVSDESDQSPRDLSVYINFFKSLKSKNNPQLLRASAVVGPSPRGCHSSRGSASPGPRYLKLARTFGGITASICEKNWSDTLSQIGLASFGARLQFPLSRSAVAESIRVRVAGLLIPRSKTNGWFYESKSNSVFFTRNRAPAPNSKIQIDYLVRCNR